MLFKKKARKTEFDIKKLEKTLEESRRLNQQMMDISVNFMANTDKMLATQNVRRS